MKNTLKPSVLKGVLLAVTLFAGAAFCEVSYGSLTDTRDGKIYKTVKIGTQTWMAENLNYTYNKGTARGYCYKDDSVNCTRYGRLYTWSAAMDSAAVFGEGGKGCGGDKTCSPANPVRGVCPEGWHLPSDAEWDTLEKFVADSLFGGKRDSVGYALKSASGWWKNGSDAVGFGALPSSYDVFLSSYDSRWFEDDLDGAYFWSATELGSFFAFRRLLYYDFPYLSMNVRAKCYALSVRCVKDS